MNQVNINGALNYIARRIALAIILWNVSVAAYQLGPFLL